MKKAPPSEWIPLEEAVPVDLFKAEVQAWARRLGVAPRGIFLRPMKRKWASCSSRGRLTFSTDLLRQPAAFRREVIVHELLHLRVPNHGPLFKALLKAYLATSPVQFVNGPMQWVVRPQLAQPFHPSWRPSCQVAPGDGLAR